MRMFRYSPRVLSEFVLHKWADTEHYKFDLLQLGGDSGAARRR